MNKSFVPSILWSMAFRSLESARYEWLVSSMAKARTAFCFSADTEDSKPLLQPVPCPHMTRPYCLAGYIFFAKESMPHSVVSEPISSSVSLFAYTPNTGQCMRFEQSVRFMPSASCTISYKRVPLQLPSLVSYPGLLSISARTVTSGLHIAASISFISSSAADSRLLSAARYTTSVSSLSEPGLS